MSLLSLRSLLLAAVAAASVAACGAPIHSVPYTPNPGRVAQPAHEVENVILANTVDGCLSETSFSERMLVVKYACANGYRGRLGNRVVRFDRIASIALEESGGWYRVLVKHNDGTPDFDWTSKNVEDMRRLADAFTAITAHVNGAPTAVPAKTTAATHI